MAQVKRAWSSKAGRLTWGFDATIHGTRFRRFGFATQDDAEVALTEFENADPDFQPGATSPNSPLKIGAVGATAELIVCTDLLQQGFDVFRSVSPNAACDLVSATNDGHLCRVEVKSAVTRNGFTRFKRHRFDKTKHDVLALVFLREGRIEYSVSVYKWFQGKLDRQFHDTFNSEQVN